MVDMDLGFSKTLPSAAVLFSFNRVCGSKSVLNEDVPAIFNTHYPLAYIYILYIFVTCLSVAYSFGSIRSYDRKESYFVIIGLFVKFGLFLLATNTPKSRDFDILTPSSSCHPRRATMDDTTVR